MKTTTAPVTNVDHYIMGFPEETQHLLDQMRATIKKAAPNAEEVISYMMPTYKQDGTLVHFAGYKGHIGFYPGPDGLQKYKKELSGYKGAKGSVQFPLDKPLPLDIVAGIVKFRLEQNSAKAKEKAKAKSKK